MDVNSGLLLLPVLITATDGFAPSGWTKGFAFLMVAATPPELRARERISSCVRRIALPVHHQWTRLLGADTDTTTNNDSGRSTRCEELLFLMKEKSVHFTQNLA
ncbi:hypothetical protein BHE74_00034591 [Ensete ventricosum]|nr:hypothetical protein GW17_00012797 [Ensete ventricosum]RWW58525.1 hypothetical protein BHE74_00034591 [Ensete ventricosum]RZR77862.1 hypothetical protein BHM03_00003070 [Ensete ventricosum]